MAPFEQLGPELNIVNREINFIPLLDSVPKGTINANLGEFHEKNGELTVPFNGPQIHQRNFLRQEIDLKQSTDEKLRSRFRFSGTNPQGWSLETDEEKPCAAVTNISASLFSHGRFQQIIYTSLIAIFFAVLLHPRLSLTGSWMFSFSFLSYPCVGLVYLLLFFTG